MACDLYDRGFDKLVSFVDSLKNGSLEQIIDRILVYLSIVIFICYF